LINIAVSSSILDLISSGIGIFTLVGSRHVGEAPVEATTLTVPWHSTQNINALSLLSWHANVSEFIGRDAEMRRLEAWAANEHPVSVNFVTGAGGTGKSRLAAEFADRLRESGWAAGFVNLRHPVKFRFKKAGTLLIIDYPEETHTEVCELLGDLAALEGTGKWRLLFLTRRSFDDWRDVIDNSHATALVSPQPVNLDAAISDDDAYALFQSAQKQAAELFRSAKGSDPELRECYPLPLPKDAFLDWLSQAPENERALFLLALAVHCAFHPKDNVVRYTGPEVIRALADRELLRLRESSKAGGFTDEYALPRLLTFAAICGEISQENLHSAVEATVLGADTWTLPCLMEKLCGLGVMKDAMVVAPKPDIVAAALVARTLARHSTLAPDIIWQSLELDLGGGIERFGRLAYDACVVLGISEAPLNTWLVAALQEFPDRCLKFEEFVYEDSLPVGLIDSAITVWRTLLTTDLDDLDKICVLNNLSADLSKTGDIASALEASRKAVEICRYLSAANPGRYEADLATSLNNLSNRLRETGDRANALEAIRETVEIRRRFAEANPARLEVDVAMSLSNLSTHLSDSGDQANALEAIREAVEIRRRLAEANPKRYEPDLAGSLNNLSNRQSESGERADALEASREAVEIYRRLVESSPARFEADLAKSLSNLSNRQSESGERADALEASSEAVEIYRRLVKANPARFEADLAMSLSNRSIWLNESGNRVDALETIHEAVKIYQHLAEANPARYEPDLAKSLVIQGTIFVVFNRRREAASAFREAADLLRPYAMHNPKSPFASLLKAIEAGYRQTSED